ncbi:MAG: signal peptidase II [Candidatus Hydrogenedentes bacterium]|nr:signal peptidase II [Candidatus Hydrogenedentota bacterium]
MTIHRKQLVWVLSVFFVVLAADQVTKALLCHYIPYGSVPFNGHERDFFWLAHERNPGLVGGMFRDVRIVAAVAPVVATAVLIYLFRHLDPRSTLQSIAYGMVAGGAIGNLVDRIFRHEVVDFLQFYFWFIPFNFPWKLYPAFNIADTNICVGVFLLLVTWCRARHDEEPHAAHAD